jgi:probable rRNA maturation factor
VLEVEVFGGARTRTGTGGPLDPVRHASAERPPPSIAEVRSLCILAAGSAGVTEGHMAVEFVDARRIAELNAEYRDEPAPTDVLAFPMDGVKPAAPAELGDVVICPEYTVDLHEAIIHGVLHLVGMDHETDDGEMLARQQELLGRARR